MKTPEELYIDLLKNCLTRYIFISEQPSFWGYTQEYIENLRRTGGDWPPTAETMVGLQRLTNVQDCMRRVLMSGVPGDFLEAGVWRGGVGILMRGILKAYGIKDRTVWVADSFQGVPPPSGEYPLDHGNTLYTARDLAIPLETVRKNYQKYDLLDDQVRFLPGWFRDTLHTAPIEKLAVLRLDGDLYESTMQTLRALYPKVSVGGFVIIDDYSLPPCRQAVTDYLSEHKISVDIQWIDVMGAYWRKC